ncbi:MAG TPA: ABC-2 family transporter protein [Candidatus Limnocylindrales bacterium]|nr:ABC-2 family transporter protein [Candidatus Limnocylindrales bacterium]
MRSLQLAWVFLRVNAMNELQYRANFFVQLLQSAIALVAGLVVIGLVFSHTDQLRGWTHPELLAVMGVHIVMGGIIGAFIQPNMLRLTEDVRDGRLDFLLTKPEDAQLLVSVREFRIWRLVDVALGGIVLGYALLSMDAALSPLGAVAFAAALFLGAAMIYCFWLFVTTFAFWIIRLDEIVELFEGIYQAGRWPVTIYPGWLRIGLTFLVPIAFAVTVPAEALANRLTVDTLVLAFGFAAFLLLATRAWWRFGLRHYSGASA